MPVKNLRQRKQELRSRYKRVREAFTPEKKASLDAQLAERFFSLPEYKEAKVIFAFVSKGIEVETGKIISGALADGKSVAVPLCDMENTEIDFYYINSRDDLTDGVFGLLEPDVSKCAKAKPDDADICIVPGLVFDREGYRLGFGKGFYDRFLGDFCGLTVALCYCACISDELPRGYYDRPVSLVVTEKYTINNLQG